VHDGLIPAFLDDLRGCVAEVASTAAAGEAGAYGTVE